MCKPTEYFFYKLCKWPRAKFADLLIYLLKYKAYVSQMLGQNDLYQTVDIFVSKITKLLHTKPVFKTPFLLFKYDYIRQVLYLTIYRFKPRWWEVGVGGKHSRVSHDHKNGGFHQFRSSLHNLFDRRFILVNKINTSNNTLSRIYSLQILINTLLLSILLTADFVSTTICLLMHTSIT